MSDNGININDLDLDAVNITVMRDSAALPETGASAASSSCGSSSCCASSSCCVSDEQPIVE